MSGLYYCRAVGATPRSRAGFVYQPQSISNLSDANWVPFGPPITGNGQTSTVLMAVGANGLGFYRLDVRHVP
jgi:hypothetical protein